MSEQSAPAVIAREAKKENQTLKEMLKSKEPFDRDLDLQRKKLRRHYLNLLLLHPNSKDSKEVEHHLWMQTSYAFIASYKQRLAAIDRAIQSHQRQAQQQQQGGQQSPQRQNNTGPVEHRKLLQKFRNFLSDEEKFWTQLVLRLNRLFDLREAQPALVALGLTIDGDSSPALAPATSTSAIVPTTSEGSEETRDGVIVVNAPAAPNGRNHFQFPPEDPSITFPPTSTEDRASKLAILSKALICLGDIARYRELYNEGKGRPRAGHEDGPARRGRNRRGGEAAPRLRNYDKAQQCYEHARSLVPDEGNPSHQLAILASYQKDSFNSLIHYYRALCVRQPYDTAAENLGTVLSKALDQWRQRTRRERDKGGVNDQPRVRTETFKERIVVRHALWRVGLDKGVAKMESIAPEINENITNNFSSLLEDRFLRIDQISNTIILSQGALWKHRMIREPPATTNRKHEPNPPPPETPALVEWSILTHLLDLHIVLLELGKEELKDPPPMDGIDDLAQRISAVFRRTLPALRITSKWLRGNIKYLMQDPEFVAYQKQQDAKGVTVSKTDRSKLSVHSTYLKAFWETYTQFMRVLAQAFPLDKLPSLASPLEEDVEMRGWLPLRGLMGDRKENDGNAVGVLQSGEQVHPNVEQLMRIWDLLNDAHELVKVENSPVRLVHGHILFNLDAVEDVRAASRSEPQILPSRADDVEPVVPIQQQRLLAAIRDTSLDLHPKKDADDDQMTEFTSRTDDDVVRDAFKFLNTSDIVEDEDNDDEIVWDPRATVSPLLSPSLQATPITPVRPMLSPKNTSPRSPTQFNHKQSHFTVPTSAPPPAPAAMTAQDLLNDVMGGFNTSRNLNGSGPSGLESTAPQPPLLFGSELPYRPIQSIWSASHDEQPLRYTGNMNNHAVNNHSAPQTQNIYQTPPRQYLSHGSQEPSQQSTVWSSSYSGQSQNSQHNLAGALPSAPFAIPPQTMLAGGGVNYLQHNRVPSVSTSSPLYTGQAQTLSQDPFLYHTSTSNQPSMVRPDPFSSGYGPASRDNITHANKLYGELNGHADYHPLGFSMHDPRHVGQQPYGMHAPMHQVWSNTG